MAYAVKYRLNFADELDIEYEVDILQEGYVGAVLPMIGDGSFPLSIEMEGFNDAFEPICHTNAILSLISKTQNEWIEFQTADVYEYYLDVKRAGTTYWKGLLVTETYEEQYTSEPYGITLTFNDGISELQWERYDNAGTLRSSMETVINILVNSFNELPTDLARPFREIINVFDDSMNDADTEGLLEQLYIFEGAFWELDDDDVIKGRDCLSVIRGIMSSLKCRIVISQDKIYIERVGELLTASTVKYVDYDSAGLVTGNGTIDLRRTLTNKSVSLPTKLAPIENDGSNSFNREFQEVTFSYSSKNLTTIDNNVVINGDFDKGYELQVGTPMPKHWQRSTAVNTQILANGTSIHVGVVNIPGIGNQISSLVIEDEMLVNTKIFVPPDYVSDVLQVDATREDYNLIAQSPADGAVTYKNLLSDTSDNLEIRFKGHFDYTYTDVAVNNSASVLMFMKWAIQLGSNYYNTSNKTWSASSANRTSARLWAHPPTDTIVTQTSTVLVKRHFFDHTISLANFPSDSVDDLTVKWFIPETTRAGNNFNSSEAISGIDITFEQMNINYVSNSSTEFSIQKVLGETGSSTLRTNRFLADVNHGDGPSSFSVNSFRLPTSNLPTTTWSSRGGAESEPGYKFLVIDPIFVNLGTYRQVWSGSLQGALELHNTVSGIDSKIFIIKGYSFNVLAAIHTVVLHEVGALSPSIVYITQIDLSAFGSVVVGDDTSIDSAETALDAGTTNTQGLGIANVGAMSVAHTQVVRGNNDNTETGQDYPL